MKQETQFSLFRVLTTSKPSGTVTLAEDEGEELALPF